MHSRGAAEARLRRHQCDALSRTTLLLRHRSVDEWQRLAAVVFQLHVVRLLLQLPLANQCYAGFSAVTRSQARSSSSRGPTFRTSCIMPSTV